MLVGPKNQDDLYGKFVDQGLMTKILYDSLEEKYLFFWFSNKPIIEYCNVTNHLRQIMKIMGKSSVY